MMIKPLHLQWLIIALSGFFAALSLNGDVVLNDNVNSRLATAYSLVHYGTWELDRPTGETPNFFAQNTVDKVQIDGHLYSTKPPLMPLAMAGEYWILHKAFGWNLDPEAQAKPIIRIMTLTFGALPHLFTLAFFLAILSYYIPDPRHRTLPLFALAFATQLPGFAVTLNNHTLGVFLLMGALYLALGLGLGRLKPTPLDFVLFGISGGLCFAVELPMTLLIAVAGLYLFYHFPKQAIFIALPAMALPLMLHFAIMLTVTGSPLPIQMRDSLYLYEGSYWRVPGGMDALNEPKGIYLFHSTFGRHGLFLLFPIFLLGVWGFIQAIINKQREYRRHIIFAGTLCSVIFAYYILTTNNYGGAAYGFRWFIPLMPILLLMGIPIWRAPCAYRRAALITLLLTISMYSAWDCYQHPWDANAEWTCNPALFGPSFVAPE